MTKRQQGIPLRPNVVIKPQFILDKFPSNDDDEEDDEILNENYESFDEEENNIKYDGNFFKSNPFHNDKFVPMEVLSEQKSGILTEKVTEKEEVVEKTEEETENEKNRQNFLDWKEKLEV
jgi:hypothetical protein